MALHRHPQARAEARHLVDVHDGSAEQMVESAIAARLDHADVDEALKLDRVRREIEAIYRTEGR